MALRIVLLSGFEHVEHDGYEGCVSTLKHRLEFAMNIRAREQRLVNNIREYEDDEYITHGEISSLTLIQRDPEQAVWLETLRTIDIKSWQGHIPLWVLADRECMKIAVLKCPCMLESCSDTIRNDRSFVMELVRKCGYILQYAPQTLRDDRQIISEAIRSEYPFEALCSALPKWRADAQLVLEVAKQDMSVAYITDNALWSCKKFRKKFVNCLYKKPNVRDRRFSAKILRKQLGRKWFCRTWKVWQGWKTNQ